MTNVLAGAPSWLAPDYRYAGDDWTGANALTYIVYEVAPTYDTDGVTVLTSGVLRSLANCTVTGIIRYQLAGRRAAPSINFAAKPMAGAIVDADNGIISLSLPAAQTLYPPQNFDLWGDPCRALLVAQPRVVTPEGAVSVGLQPIFVF